MLQEGLKGRGISLKTIFEVISIAVDSDLEVVYQRLLLRGDKKKKWLIGLSLLFKYH